MTLKDLGIIEGASREELLDVRTDASGIGGIGVPYFQLLTSQMGISW